MAVPPALAQALALAQGMAQQQQHQHQTKKLDLKLEPEPPAIPGQKTLEPGKMISLALGSERAIKDFKPLSSHRLKELYLSRN